MPKDGPRRTRGSGTIRDRGEGVWQIRYVVGYRPDGQPKQRAEKIKGTRRHAEKVLRERLAAVETGNYVERKKETLAAFLDSWLSIHAATHVSPRTLKEYRGSVKHIVNGMGHIQVQALTPQHIVNFHKQLQDSGLSNSVIQHCHRVLHNALEIAIDWGIITRNPVSQVKAPKVKPKEIIVWDMQTLTDFLDAASDSQFLDIYKLAVLTGLRRSELTGLQWPDVEPDSHTLRVKRTLQRVPGKKLLEGAPKSEAGKRSISLSQAAIDILDNIRTRQLQRQIETLGIYNNGDDYVFTDEWGKPLDGDRLTKDFIKVVRRHNLPYATFHSLRHIHVSLLLNEGASLRLIAERVGHSDPSLTLRVYSHLLPGAQMAAAERLDKLIGLG